MSETIKDLDDVLSGPKSSLAIALGQILEDTNTYEKLKTAKGHLQRAKKVLSKGVFDGNDEAWFLTHRARDGVVS